MYQLLILPFIYSWNGKCNGQLQLWQSWIGLCRRPGGILRPSRSNQTQAEFDQSPLNPDRVRDKRRNFLTNFGFKKSISGSIGLSRRWTFQLNIKLLIAEIYAVGLWWNPIGLRSPTLKNLPGVPVENCKMKNQSATFFEFKIFHIESQSAFCMI